jgi:hypothetical protein
MDALIAPQKGWCVSIYVPTKTTSVDSDKNRIRLKNLLGDARKQLQELGVSREQARQLLEPAEGLAKDGPPARHDREGLVMLLSSDVTFTRRLPGEVPTLAVVNEDRFHIKPLLGFRETRNTFFVLSLSQNHVRLFEGGKHHFSERTEVDLPESLAEALWLDDPESTLQQHVTRKVQGGSRFPAMFSGSPGRLELEKEHLLRYFRRIDASLSPWLNARGSPRPPLVLACVEYYLPIYAEANTYGNLAGETIAGNPDHVEHADLQARAWSIVGSRFDENEEEARTLFRRRAGDSSATSHDIDEILVAAHGDRIDTLFISDRHQQWGRIVSTDQGVEMTHHEAFRAGDVDLLDVAAAETLRRGGRVFTGGPEAIPAESPAAALFRF